MIDLSQHHDSMLIKHGGIHINAAQAAIAQLELYARMGHEAGAMAQAQRAKEACERFLSTAAWVIDHEG